MKCRLNRLVGLFLGVSFLSCSPEEMTDAPMMPAVPTLEATTAELESYLRPLASRLARRPLLETERQLIAEKGVTSVEEIVRTWLELPAFQDAARDMMEHLLKTSGKLGEIDFDLPGNLTAHIVREKLPYSTLLTADYCIDDEGEEAECDTSAPYVAGVLTTRAYLSANASRFNLRRASTLMNVFSCRGYPMEFDLQPSATKQELIPMFQAQTPEEQTVEEAQNGFGNGFGCYTCHSQFANHAQLYVKFDSTGLWRSHAHGVQDEYGELGRSIGRYFASHFHRLERSEDERAQVFGQEVANLAEAGAVIAAEASFVECASRRAFEYAFDLDETLSAKSDIVLYKTIAQKIQDAGINDPTFQELFYGVVTDPLVVRSFIDQR